MGYASLAPVDAYMSKHRKPIIIGVALVVTAGLPLFHWLKFDFNPIHLRNTRTELVATYLDLKRDRSLEIDNIQLLEPDIAAADKAAARLSQVPEVAAVRSLQNMVPTQQDEKLDLIRKTAAALKDLISPTDLQPAPSDAEVADSLNEVAQRLREAAQDPHNAGQTQGMAGATRLAEALTALANAGPRERDAAREAMVAPLVHELDQLRLAFTAEQVTLASLPPELVERMAHAGRATAPVHRPQGPVRRRREAARLCPRRAEGRTGRHGGTGVDLHGGPDHRPRLSPGRRLGAALDRDPAHRSCCAR